jgi:hypothetical protein
MAQKRVLVVGAVLVAAGVGAPTAAMLTQGGAPSEARTPVVDATTPEAPPAPEPAGAPVEVAAPVAEQTPPATAPRRARAAEVPSHLGSEDLPPREPAAAPPPTTTTSTTTAAPPDPPAAPAAPSPVATQPEPPPMPTFEPDPADEGDDGSFVPPPMDPGGDVDPADQ